MESNGLTIWREYLPLLTVLLFMTLVEQLIKRLIGTSLMNKKESPLLDVIKKLDEACNLDNLISLRNVCIFPLAFTGFLFQN